MEMCEGKLAWKLKNYKNAKINMRAMFKRE